MQSFILRRSSRASAVAFVVAGLVTAPAAADTFFGLEHSVIGDAVLVEEPVGFTISNIGSTGKDGVEVTIPPHPTHHRLAVWTGTVEGLSEPGTLSSTRLLLVGQDDGGVPATACAMRLELGGVPALHIELSPPGTTGLTARYFDGGVLVHEENGLPPADALLALGTIQLADIGFSAHWDNIQKRYILDGHMSVERTIGGTVLPACDAFEVEFETLPPVAVHSLGAVQLLVSGPSSVHVTAETYDVTLACIGDLDDDGAVGFSDVVTVLSSWGPCAGCAADLDADGVVGFADLLSVLSAWGACPSE